MSYVNSQRVHRKHDAEKPDKTLHHRAGPQTPLVSLLSRTYASIGIHKRLLTNETGVCRVAGNAAKDVDIHQSVCEQMERTFSKSKWKVRNLFADGIVTDLVPEFDSNSCLGQCGVAESNNRCRCDSMSSLS